MNSAALEVTRTAVDGLSTKERDTGPVYGVLLGAGLEVAPDDEWMDGARPEREAIYGTKGVPLWERKWGTPEKAKGLFEYGDIVSVSVVTDAGCSKLFCGAAYGVVVMVPNVSGGVDKDVPPDEAAMRESKEHQHTRCWQVLSLSDEGEVHEGERYWEEYEYSIMTVLPNGMLEEMGVPEAALKEVDEASLPEEYAFLRHYARRCRGEAAGNDTPVWKLADRRRALLLLNGTRTWRDIRDEVR